MYRSTSPSTVAKWFTVYLQSPLLDDFVQYLGHLNLETVHSQCREAALIIIPTHRYAPQDGKLGNRKAQYSSQSNG